MTISTRPTSTISTDEAEVYPWCGQPDHPLWRDSTAGRDTLTCPGCRQLDDPDRRTWPCAGEIGQDDPFVKMLPQTNGPPVRAATKRDGA